MHFNAASQLEPQQEGLAQEGEAASSPPAISPTPPLDQFPGPGGGSSVSSASVGTANPTVPASDEQPARQTAQLISDLRAEMLEINQSNSHNSRLLMMHIKNQSAELAELKKQTACVYSASSVRGEEEENLHGQADSGGGALRRQGSSLPPRAFPRRPEYLQLPEEDEQIMVQRAPPARALSRWDLRDEASPERDARVYGHIDFPRETDFPRELERQSAVVARGARPLERQETRRLDQAQGSRVAQDGRRGAAYDPPPPPPPEDVFEYDERAPYHERGPQRREVVTRPNLAPRRATSGHVQPPGRHDSPPPYYEDERSTKRKGTRGQGKCIGCGGIKVECMRTIRFVGPHRYSQHQGFPCVTKGGCQGCNQCLFEGMP